MEALTTVSLFIFGIIATAILTAGLVFYEKNNFNNPAQNNSAAINSSELINRSADGDFILNAAEVAKHNSAADCWLIISGKVYNVTGYLSSHPGGADAITPFCGADATTAFLTKGGNGSHSSFAASLLADYYLGDFNQTLKTPQIQESINKTNSVQVPSDRGESENEADDE